MVEPLAELTPEISVISPEKLLEGAIKAYNEHQEDLAFENGPFYEWERLTEDSDARDLARIQADYILQRLSNYDKLRLTALPKTVGWPDALAALQTKFFDALDKAYPALHEEWIRYRSELRDERRRMKQSCGYK